MIKINRKLRVQILNEIFNHFQAESQWLLNGTDRVVDYHCRAEALIEVLEVADCGSVGGYDKSNPPAERSRYNLYDRFLTLINKYDDEKKIKGVCGFSVDGLNDYFNNVIALRGEHLS